jgi:hypothetical protein
MASKIPAIFLTGEVFIDGVLQRVAASNKEYCTRSRPLSTPRNSDQRVNYVMARAYIVAAVK